MPDAASLVNRLSAASEGKKEIDAWAELRDAIPFST
jgi:hypothetical protein